MVYPPVLLIDVVTTSLSEESDHCTVPTALQFDKLTTGQKLGIRSLEAVMNYCNFVRFLRHSRLCLYCYSAFTNAQHHHFDGNTVAWLLAILADPTVVLVRKRFPSCWFETIHFRDNNAGVTIPK